MLRKSRRPTISPPRRSPCSKVTAQENCIIPERNQSRIESVNSSFLRRHKCRSPALLVAKSPTLTTCHETEHTDFRSRRLNFCLNLTQNRRLAAELFRIKVRPTESFKARTSQISFQKFGYFGTECLRIEPPHSTQGLFSPKAMTGVLLL